MIKEKIKGVVKYNKSFFRLYFFLGNIGLRIIKLFVKQDPRLILITCYGGKKYDDSPKAIYERLLKDNRFDDFKIVWAFIDPHNYNLPRGSLVKIDTLAYYVMMYKAKVWITNSGMERGLYFNAKNVYSVQTWHGTTIKKMGFDTNGDAFGSLKETPTSLWLAQSKYDVEIIKSSFRIPDEVLQITGLPRNDELVSCNEDKQNIYKKKLGIPLNKKVILYAPTYREYARDNGSSCIMAPPIDLKKWQDNLGEKYYLLFRAHYEVTKILNVEESCFCRDVSSYENLNELMMASDILLSDYSSLFFDFSILERPMLVFAYDYDDYIVKRGVYFDIREELQDYASTEDEVIYNIQNIDEEKRIQVARRFKSQYIEECGSASEKVLNLIFENCSE